MKLWRKKLNYIIYSYISIGKDVISQKTCHIILIFLMTKKYSLNVKFDR